MTKRKTFRLSEQSRNSLKAELSKYKSGPPLGKLAKVYGVSLSTVNHHWGAIKKARKAKHATVKSVKDYNPKIMGKLAHGVGTALMTSSAVKPTYVATAWSEPLDESIKGILKPLPKPNGPVTVTIAQEWLKPIVEEVARTEVRDFLQTAFRK